MIDPGHGGEAVPQLISEDFGGRGDLLGGGGGRYQENTEEDEGGERTKTTHWLVCSRKGKRPGIHDKC
jgi:hypothetical protein